MPEDKPSYIEQVLKTPTHDFPKAPEEAGFLARHPYLGVAGGAGVGYLAGQGLGHLVTGFLPVSDDTKFLMNATSGVVGGVLGGELGRKAAAHSIIQARDEELRKLRLQRIILKKLKQSQQGNI